MQNSKTGTRAEMKAIFAIRLFHFCSLTITALGMLHSFIRRNMEALGGNPIIAKHLEKICQTERTELL